MKQRMRQEVTDKTERSNGRNEKEKEEEKEGTRSECIMEEKSQENCVLDDTACQFYIMENERERQERSRTERERRKGGGEGDG